MSAVRETHQDKDDLHNMELISLPLHHMCTCGKSTTAVCVWFCQCVRVSACVCCSVTIVFTRILCYNITIGDFTSVFKLLGFITQRRVWFCSYTKRYTSKSCRFWEGEVPDLKSHNKGETQLFWLNCWLLLTLPWVSWVKQWWPRRKSLTLHFFHDVFQ